MTRGDIRARLRHAAFMTLCVMWDHVEMIAAGVGAGLIVLASALTAGLVLALVLLPVVLLISEVLR